MPALLFIPVGLVALGFFADKTGEGIESASNGIIKVAAAGAALYFVGKKAKVI